MCKADNKTSLAITVQKTKIMAADNINVMLRI